MHKIPSRWEWRTFGSAFGDSEEAIWRVATIHKQAHELYVFSKASMATIKLRDHIVDVKLPMDPHATGLESWSPTFRLVFPLEQDVIHSLFAAWNLPVPRLGRDTYNREAFWNDIVEPHAALTPVDVTKHLHQGWLHRCLVEVSDVSFDGYATRSLAVMSLEDPYDVVRTLRMLRLSQYDDVNYVQALRRHVALRGCPVRVRGQRLAQDDRNLIDARSYV